MFGRALHLLLLAALAGAPSYAFGIEHQAPKPRLEIFESSADTQWRNSSATPELRWENRTAREAVASGCFLAPKIGHATPWKEMNKAQKEAFQHSYSRHHKELGLPNWKGKEAARLQEQFNRVVGHIRSEGTLITGMKKPFNAASVDVDYFEATIPGTKYYYYETIEGLFISAGKSR